MQPYAVRASSIRDLFLWRTWWNKSPADAKAARRPVSRVLSVPCEDETAIPLGRASRRASRDQPGRRGGNALASAARVAPRGSPAAPIRSCSRWGLPCRPRCRGRGALLPHRFALAGGGRALAPAVCFLWHYPWGRPRRPLAGTVFPWSPDFPPRPKPQRPSGRLAREDMRCAACRVKLAVVPKRDGLSNRDRPQGQAVLECRALVPE